MPAVGVYQYNWELLQACYECLDQYSEADLQFYAMTEPLFEIIEKVKKGEVNYYIGREMFEGRLRFVEDIYGVSGITYDSFADNAWECWGESNYCWEIFSDMICEPNADMEMLDFVQVNLQSTSEILICVHMHTPWLYVLKSTYTAMCREIEDTGFGSSADAGEEGNKETWVLPPKVLEAAMEFAQHGV